MNIFDYIPLFWIGISCYCWAFIAVICLTQAFSKIDDGTEKYNWMSKGKKVLIVLGMVTFIAAIPGYNIYFVLKNIKDA